MEVQPNIQALWLRPDPAQWDQALEHYWCLVRDDHFELEREMDRLELDSLRKLDQAGWYDFLREKYFKWKYTAPNRYATTTMHLERQKGEPGGLEVLFQVKLDLLNLDRDDIAAALAIPRRIRGLGIAGASGLLALMYPKDFGTVDQFVVKALEQVLGLMEGVKVANPASIGLKAGVRLIEIMRAKAEALNRAFGGTEWTPRKVDMVLWGLRKPIGSPSKCRASERRSKKSLRNPPSASMNPSS